MKKYNEGLDADDDAEKIKLFNKPLTIERSIFTLQGISAAIIYDGKIDDSEIELLVEWMVAHEEQRSVWPISKVYEVLKRILEDDLVTQYERVDLFNVLSSIADAPDSEKTVDDIYDEDPDIIFPDNEFLVYWKAKIWNKEES